MKVVILAGGLGTRLGEETSQRPKPMVEIGGKPILWHIMKIYAAQGFKEFIVLLGYKGYMVKEYFLNFHMLNSDFTIDLDTNSVDMHGHSSEPWKVTLVDTGLESGTAYRLKQIEKYVGNEPFMLTYGDGVSDINLTELLETHKEHGGMITLTSVQPGGRFGKLHMDDSGSVRGFAEKPLDDGGWINAGFMVMEPSVFKLLPDDAKLMMEPGLLEPVAAMGQLHAYKHMGFWHAMDSLRDKQNLEGLWAAKAPWKTWADETTKTNIIPMKKSA